MAKRKKYVVTSGDGVTFSSGEIELTEDQARRRKHKVTPIKGKKNMYRIDKPLWFKAGEVVSLADGLVEQSRRLAIALTPEEQHKQAQAELSKSMTAAAVANMNADDARKAVRQMEDVGELIKVGETDDRKTVREEAEKRLDGAVSEDVAAEVDEDEAAEDVDGETIDPTA
jgi:hypothetical protein